MTADTQKPTIEAVIQHLSFLSDPMSSFAAGYLRELAAIKNQPVPVEPEFFKNFRATAAIHTAYGNASEVADLVGYIDTLQSALQASLAAQAMLRGELGMAWTERNTERDRAEKTESALKVAQQNLAAAEQNVSDLMAENAVLTAKHFKESNLAGGRAVSAAEDSLPAAGGSPAFLAWAAKQFGDVRPIDLHRLQWAFDEGVKHYLTTAESRNRRMVELFKDEYRVARLFHEIYEEFAPAFGYSTKEETRVFNPDSENGKLMIATCKAVASELLREVDNGQ